jgi:magnesium transporter
MTKDMKLIKNETLDRLVEKDISWYWLDLDEPNRNEELLLSDFFNFNEFAVEDCLNHLERPKVDYFDTYNFFVLNAIKQETFEPIEMDIFLGKNYIVSFHRNKLDEIEKTIKNVLDKKDVEELSASYISYLIIDNIVDTYFPELYKTEERLNEIGFKSEDMRKDVLIDKVFDVAAALLKQRYVVNSMKELLYRIINSNHLKDYIDCERHFSDIYDHLLKLCDTIDSNRELTSEIKDNYMSINSYRMNKIMTILTIITTIFIPLTFIVGVYGMNFDYMPELKLRYGYFMILGLMVAIGFYLFLWFKRKGWFD